MSACLLLLNGRSRCLLHTQCPLTLNIVSFLSGFGFWWVFSCEERHFGLCSCPLDAWSVPNTAQPSILTLSFYLILKLQLLVEFFPFLKSADPPRGLTGVHHRRVPPYSALGRDRHQRTEGHLPHYNPLLVRPPVCSRSLKTSLGLRLTGVI